MSAATLVPGLVSVTFRPHTPQEIVAAVRRAGLATIEWGGDVHVPVGRTALAREVAHMTHDAGLSVAAYGSYFRLGTGGDIQPYLATANELGAPTVRIWAGQVASAEASASMLARMADELRAACDRARQCALTLSLEFHEGTIADSSGSVVDLMRRVAHPALRTYWQTVNRRTALPELKQEIATLLPWLTNLHVFNRDVAAGQWEPLAAAREDWKALLAVAAQDAQPHAVMLEFVRGGGFEQFHHDAQVLTTLVADVGR